MARLNRFVANPVLRPVAHVLPPFAVVKHEGRASGRPYRTPVFAFRRGGEVLIVLSYGRQSDWVRNVLSNGSGGLIRLGRNRLLANPRVVAVAECGPMSPLGRFSSRFADHVLVADVVDRDGH
jgi:deazaflavin-dependent oxidoreductase (nitroreductase family)